MESKKDYLAANYISPATRHWENVSSLNSLAHETKVFLSRLCHLAGKGWHQTFALDGHHYKYHAHRYNMTWRSERTVEVAFMLRLLQENSEKRFLEIGNVMSYYIKHDHEVIDKYERSPQCANVDVMECVPVHPFDIVFSISTIEHMGFDEPEKEPLKPLRAVERLQERFLKPGGLLVVTYPFGYNPHLDELTQNHRMPFTTLKYLRRVSRLNRWEQTDLSGVLGSRYNTPFPHANALVIGIFEKPSVQRGQ